MLLAVDIGNSRTKFGVFAGEKLVFKFAITTEREQTAAEIFEQIKKLAQHDFEALIISSVVPPLKKSYEELAENFCRTNAIFVTRDFDGGLKNLYATPETLGIDRFITAFAAAEKYGAPCIACGFGTATTIDFVTKNKEFAGGIIAPGMQTMTDSLFQKTAKLPKVEIEKPESIFGKTTVSAIQAGIFYGYIGLVEGILRKMIEESGERPKIVATGGFAELIAENCELIETVDENLMLEGLRKIYEKILPTKHTKSTKIKAE